MSGVQVLRALKVDRNAIRPAPTTEPLEGKPAFLGDDLKARIADEPSWQSPRPPYTPFAATIENASVVSPHFSVFTPDGAAIKESLYLTDLENAAAAMQSARRKTSDSPSAFLAANRNYGHYYHFTTQCLAALSLIASGTCPDDLPLLTGPLAGWQKRLLALAGFAEHKVEVLEKGNAATYARLIYPSLLARRDHIVWPGMRSLYEPIRRSADRSKHFGDRLYVSRQDAADRPLQNEAELAERLAAMRFRTIVGGKLSVDEQIAAFSRAKVIVAPHGAGLANIVYCEPGTAIYELHPAHYVKSCYYWLSQLFELAYWGDCFPTTGTMQPTRENRQSVPWRVDVETVVGRVETILSSRV